MIYTMGYTQGFFFTSELICPCFQENWKVLSCSFSYSAFQIFFSHCSETRKILPLVFCWKGFKNGKKSYFFFLKLHLDGREVEHIKNKTFDFYFHFTRSSAVTNRLTQVKVLLLIFLLKFILFHRIKAAK